MKGARSQVTRDLEESIEQTMLASAHGPLSNLREPVDTDQRNSAQRREWKSKRTAPHACGFHPDQILQITD